MVQEVNETLRVCIEFDANNNSREVESLLKRATRLGGEIIELSLTTSLEGSDVVPPYLITEREFRAWAVDNHPQSPAWISRNWVEGLTISNDIERNAKGEGGHKTSADHTINLHNILEYFRSLEEGSQLWGGVGKTGWNLFAGIINTRLAQDDLPVVLPWDDEIHNMLRSDNVEKRQFAATTIKQLYAKSQQYQFDI